MTYDRELEQRWAASCDMLTSSEASEYLNDILSGKVSRRGGGSRCFFGEAYGAEDVVALRLIASVRHKRRR